MNNSLQIHIEIIGILLILLGIIHVIFPRYFNWKEDLKDISLINRQLLIVHTFFIALVVFLMGILCFTYSDELIKTELGKIISLGFGLFWLVRLIFQFFVYSSKLWKGKKFETIVHILFSILWFYLTLIFLMNYFN